MKLRAGLAGLMVLIAIVISWRSGDFARSADAAESSRTRRGASAGSEPDAESELTVPRRVRTSSREDLPADATHGPHQLRDFYLATLEINGLPLEAALQRVRAAYEEACRTAGETPLPLRFHVPLGVTRPLTLSLRAKSMDTSVRLLAALSGLKVRRDGMNYHFSEPEALDRTVKIALPSSFMSSLTGFLNQDSGASGLRELLTAMGLELSPDTTLPFENDAVITTRSAADRAAISALMDLVEKNPPIQHQTETTLIKLPPDSTWQMPEVASFSADDSALLMRELSQHHGIEAKTLPSITSLPGQEARIELTRDLIVPENNERFRVMKIGMVIDSAASPLGFGAAANFTVENTDAGLDPVTGQGTITDHLYLTESFYANNSDAHVMIKTHPDGSRTLVLVTHTRVDATGAPK